MSESTILPQKVCPNSHCRKTDNTDFSTCRYCGTSYSANPKANIEKREIPVLQIVLAVCSIVASGYLFSLNHSQPNQPSAAGTKIQPGFIFRGRSRGLAIPVAAAVFFSKKALDDADQDIKSANFSLQQNANDYDAYIKRGDAYWTKFMLTPAIADYSTAIWLKPTRADAYDKRANVYEMQKRFSEAQSDRKRSKELRKALW